MISLTPDLKNEIVRFVSLKDVRALACTSKEFSNLDAVVEAVVHQEILDRGGQSVVKLIAHLPKKYIKNYKEEEQRSILSKHTVTIGRNDDFLEISFALHRSPSLLHSMVVRCESFETSTIYKTSSSCWMCSVGNGSSPLDSNRSIYRIVGNVYPNFHLGYTREWQVRDVVISVYRSTRVAGIIQQYAVDSGEEEVCPRCLQEGYFKSDLYNIIKKEK